MKRLLSFTLVTLLMLSLFGCAQETVPPTPQSQPQAQTQAVETEAATVVATQAQTVASTTAQDENIGENKAKEIALDHAQLKETDVTRLFVELDYDDGILRYEIDFKYGGYEYDYDIDAKTGAILSYDKDFDD